jgi:hypothetical protein
MGNLVKWINSHSSDGKPLVIRSEGSALIVREIYTKDGEAGESQAAIPATLAAAREWLGY